MLARVGSAKVARISGVRGAPSLGKSELMIGLKGANVPVPQEGVRRVQLFPPGRAAAAETSARSESFEMDMMASDAIATQWDGEPYGDRPQLQYLYCYTDKAAISQNKNTPSPRSSNITRTS
jgi:hypothetical protein